MSLFGTKPPDVNRRRFLERSLAVGAATAGTHFLSTAASAGSFDREDHDARRPLTKGDIAILRFLAAAEILETDLWQQYAELGGVEAVRISGSCCASSTRTSDQYISDNTDDEISHATFLNAYLASKGARPVNLDEFRTLPGSQATGAQAIGRLTNLMQLTVDTSWWTRYRATRNPDLGATSRKPSRA